jgi:hypothetical protein
MEGRGPRVDQSRSIRKAEKKLRKKRKIIQKPYERQMELAEEGKKRGKETDCPVLVRIQDVLIRAPDPP